ncbi:MAG: aldo/keto reductase family protein [Candidatus Geothermarchaeales archaeon]
MDYRRLGKHGVRVSEISLGAWLTYGGAVKEEQSHACIASAIENGVNFIDIADVYAGGEAEKVVGKFLEEETVRRQDVVISSKVFWPMSENINDRGLSRKHIRESIAGTLERLGQTYIDIYYCHRFDRRTPLEETVSTMSDLVDEGLVHYWGTSVWTAANLERAVGVANELGAHPPAVEQPRYNMLDRYIEVDVMDSAVYHGIGLTVWSPLAGGILTGKYSEGIPEDSRAAKQQWMQKSITDKQIMKVRELGELAESLGVTVSQLALAWILRRPEISCAITGATKPEHIESNVKASEVKLSDDNLAQIEEMLDNAPEQHQLYRPPW